MPTPISLILTTSINLALAGPNDCTQQISQLILQLPTDQKNVLQALFAQVLIKNGEEFVQALANFQATAACFAPNQEHCASLIALAGEMQQSSGQGLEIVVAQFLYQFSLAINNYSSLREAIQVSSLANSLSNKSGSALALGFSQFLNAYVNAINAPTTTANNYAQLDAIVEQMMQASGEEMTLLQAKMQTLLSQYFVC